MRDIPVHSSGGIFGKKMLFPLSLTRWLLKLSRNTCNSEKRIISAHVVKISTLPENYFVADAAVRWSEYPVPQSKAYCTTIMPAPLIWKRNVRPKISGRMLWKISYVKSRHRYFLNRKPSKLSQNRPWRCRRTKKNHWKSNLFKTR